MKITHWTQEPNFEVVEHGPIDLDNALGKIRSLPLPEADLDTCPPSVGLRNETGDSAQVARLGGDQFFVSIYLSEQQIEKWKQEGTQEDAEKVIELFFQSDKVELLSCLEWDREYSLSRFEQDERMQRKQTLALSESSPRKILISHSAQERSLAEDLATWLDAQFTNHQTFCSSRPGDIVHGEDWKGRVIAEAKADSIIILLLSPDSFEKPWIHFEAGLALGSEIQARVVPTVYGGLRISQLPSTINHLQALDLCSEEQFNAFVMKVLLNGARLSDTQRWSHFQQNLSPIAKRVLEFGEPGGWIDDPVETECLGPFVFSTEGASREFPLFEGERRIVAIRATLVPRKTGAIVQWKCGFSFERKTQSDEYERTFEFHSGTHEGDMTWSLYATPAQIVPFNFPANLELEKPHYIQVWFSADGNELACVGIDSQGTRTVMWDERHNQRWRPDLIECDRVVLKAWADRKPYRVHVESLEIDRIALVES